MPNILDAKTNGASATSISVTLALGTLTTHVLAFAICANSSIDQATSATLGPDAVTLNALPNINGNRAYWIGAQTALTGDRALTVQWDSGSFHRLFAVAMNDLNTSTPFGTPTVIGAASGATASFGAMTSATGNLLVGFLQENNGASITLGTGSSFINPPFSASSTFAHGFTEPGAASVTFDATFGFATTYFGFAVDTRAPSGSGATASGTTRTATASLIAGSASAQSGATASGTTRIAVASLIAGSATGQITGLLNFQAAGLEFGARVGLAIDTFAIDAAVNYQYTVHADGTPLGAAILTSSVIALDSTGKLPNLRSALLTPGATYRVHAVRQSDGEAATFRLQAQA